MATRLPQTPHTLLERILADADVDTCGRDDFLMLNRCLRAELVAFGSTASDREWYSGQLSFLRTPLLDRSRNCCRRLSKVAGLGLCKAQDLLCREGCIFTTPLA